MPGSLLLASAIVVVTLAFALWLVLAASTNQAFSRWSRTVRVGALGSRMATSRLGAWFRKRFAGPEGRARIDEARRKEEAERVTREMGNMKGALMKLGQMMSFVSDDIPAEYRLALSSLQASAPPMDFPLIRDAVERELGAELERRFARFDTEALAAASIGQVHRAELPSGEEVVVKVQYPGVAQAITADLDSVDMIHRFMSMVYPALDPAPVVAELRERIGEELDYRIEAKNQAAFVDLYREHPFIRVPQVIASHSAGRVLTSEYVAGRRFDAIKSLSQEERNRYGEILYRFVFGTILRFGVFNGDPHPGNYLFDEQGRVVFLDYGCVKYFPPAMLQRWHAVIAAHLSGDRERFRELILAHGFIKPDTDIPTDLLYDYFAYFYEPFRLDRVFRFTREYNQQSFRMVFAPEGRFEGLHTKLNMPKDFVFVNRIQWGVYSVLADLEAEANWHHIHRELLFGAPPATPLGLEEQAYRDRWLAERGVAFPLRLTTDGLVSAA